MSIREDGAVSVGVIGLGYWGPNLVRNLNASRRTRVAGLCDLDERRLDEVGVQYPAVPRSTDSNDVINDQETDAVAIATPVGTHFGLAEAALRAGKHVLVEKPLAATSTEAEDLIALAGEMDRVLMVDHVFLYNPAVQKLVELVRGGELGDLHFVDSVRINLGLFQHDVNVVWDLAPHDLSIIDHVVGRPAQQLVAVGARHAHDDLVNVAYLHIDYGDELLASVHVNWLSPVKIRHFLVGGSRRSVLYDDLDRSERIKVYDRGVDVAEDPEGIRRALVSYRMGDVVSPKIESVEALRNMVEHFADCIEKEQRPISDGEQGLRVVQLLEAADRSIARGGALVTV